MSNCKVCRHKDLDVVHTMVRSGLSVDEIMAEFGDDFAERTLQRHIAQHMPEQKGNKRVLDEIPTVQGEIRDSIAELNLCEVGDSASAELVILKKMFACAQRLEAIAKQTGSIKAEVALMSGLQAAMTANSKIEFGNEYDDDEP